MAASKNRFDVNDVGISMMSTASGRRRLRRHSRANDLRSTTLTLTHRPTGLVLTGEVPEGHYSRKQMRDLVAKLEQDLLLKLAELVTKKSRAK
jgi:hypothetical protein